MSLWPIKFENLNLSATYMSANGSSMEQHKLFIQLLSSFTPIYFMSVLICWTKFSHLSASYNGSWNRPFSVIKNAPLRLDSSSKHTAANHISNAGELVLLHWYIKDEKIKNS